MRTQVLRKHRGLHCGLRIRAALLALVCWLPRFTQAQAPTTNDQTAEDLTWTTESTGPRRYVAVHGRKALISGYSNGGLEIWAYPVQIVKAYSVNFRPEGASTDIEGLAVLRRITYSPESVTRIYVGPDFIVREKLFVPLERPGAIISYEVNSPHPINIVVRFTPVLDLMWPASLGGQEIGWNSAASAYVLSEPTQRFSATIASPDIVSHDETLNLGQPLFNELGVSFTIRAGGTQDQRIYKVIVASIAGNGDPTVVARNLLNSDVALEQDAVAHYSDLLASGLQIETPDPEVNRALSWSKVALDHAWVCNPDLGCGPVAGYGPSRKARRPQYAWFFAGDAVVYIRALLSAGEYSRAREALEFIIKYQDPKTGMVWHELSQSAGLLDWVGKYPYMFVHVDITFQYLSTLREYVSVTGDETFLKAHWTSVQAAYQYCHSLVDSSDGLPHIPVNKEGANEQDSLEDELSLSASWVEASESFSQMAAWTRHDSEVSGARLASQKARAAISQRYWSQDQQFWVSGHTRSGKPVVDRSIVSGRVLSQGFVSKDQLDSLLDRLASADFQTDWGTRSLALSSPAYDPNSYAKGSVWAIATAESAETFWSEHRPWTAMPMWEALIQWMSLDAFGHMHEVLAGDYYHEELESVPEQTWSSSAFLSAAVRGLFGLKIDARSNSMTFSPHLPSTWGTVALRNIHLRDSSITMVLTHTQTAVELDLSNAGAPVNVVFAPEVPFGARLVRSTLGKKPIPASQELNSADTHARVELEVPHGESHLSIQYAGGASLFSPRSHAVVGNPSSGVKITSAKLRERKLTLGVDFVPSSISTVELRTPWNISNVQGAALQPLSPGLYLLRLRPSSSSSTSQFYEHALISVSFAPDPW